MINSDSVQTYFLNKMGETRLTRHFEEALAKFPEKIDFLIDAYDTCNALDARLNWIKEAIKRDSNEKSMLDSLTEMNLIEQRQSKLNALIKSELSDINVYLTHENLH